MATRRAFTPLEGSQRVLQQQLGALRERPADPSVAAAVLDLLRRWPLISREAQPLWTEALGVLLLHGGTDEGAALIQLAKQAVPRMSDAAARWRVSALQVYADALRRCVAGPWRRDAADAQLLAALQRWRSTRSSSQAEAVEARSRQLTAGQEPLPRRGLTSAWLERESVATPDDLGALLDDLSEGKGTEIFERTRLLLGYPDDPRVAAAALACLARPVVYLGSGHVLWPSIAALLAIHADARALEPAEDLAIAHPEFRWLPSLLRRRLPLAATDAPAAAPSPPPQRATPPAPRTVADWERWVLEEPADTARRQIFADWLLERKDPRGELIALQTADRPLTPREEARVRALVKKHSREWLAPLWRCLRKGSERFRAGFLSSLEVFFSRVVDVPPVDHPLWITVEALDLSSSQTNVGGLVELIRSPKLDGLRRLGGLPDHLLAAALATPRPHLSTLGGALPWRDEAVGPFLAHLRSSNLPSLRALRLSGHAQLARVASLFEGPLFRQLEWLSLDGPETLGALLDRAAPLERLRTVEVLPFNSRAWAHTEGFAFRFARDTGERWTLTASGKPPPHNPRDLRAYLYESWLTRPLSTLRAGQVTALRLEVGKDFAPPAGFDLRRLADTLGAALA